MKKSSKLTAAGVGLLIAAAAGMGPSFAGDGTTPTSADGVQVGGVNTKVPDVAGKADGGTLNLGQDEAKDADNSAKQDEDASSSTSEEEKVEDGAVPSTSASPAEGSAESDADKSTESDEATGSPEPVAESSTEAGEEDKDSAVVAGGNDEGAANDEAGKNESSGAVSKAEEPVETKPAVPEKVVYEVVSASAAADAATDTGQLGPVLIGTASFEAAANAGNGGEMTPNGQTTKLFFELPPAAGPALTPGSTTVAPLIGTAVSETSTSASDAINAAIISAETTSSVVNANGNVAQATGETGGVSSNVVGASVASGSQSDTGAGVMARSLARTGSVAQYAALMSAVAMIIGVGMLIGAFATRRHQVN